VILHHIGNLLGQRQFFGAATFVDIAISSLSLNDSFLIAVKMAFVGFWMEQIFFFGGGEGRQLVPSPLRGYMPG